MSFSNFTTGSEHSFDGKYLELVPFSLNSRPVCDISLDELEVLSRLPLRSDLIKPTHQRTCLVELVPGVNLYVKLLTQDDASSADEQDSRRIFDERARQEKVRALIRDALAILERPSSFNTDISQKKTRRSKDYKY